MKHHFLLKLLAMLFITTLVACSKKDEDDLISFPLALKATTLENQGAVRLFTMNGEVKDKETIDQFISNSLAFGQAFDVSKVSPVAFLSVDSFQVGFSQTLYEVEQQNGQFIFSTATLIEEDLNGRNMYLARTALDRHHLSKHNTPLDTARSLTGKIYTGKEIIIANGSHSSLIIPLLSVKAKRIWSNGLQGTWGGTLFSEFNEGFLSSLGNRDTVAIQQHYFRFERMGENAPQ